MFKAKFTLFILVLCVLQHANGRPTTDTASNSTKAALVTTDKAATVKPNDAEIINIDFEKAYRDAAAANGMDPAIVAEVIRNKKPVIKTEIDENGAKRTTTYKLEPDGSISRHTFTEYSATAERVQNTAQKTTPQKSAAVTKIEQDWEWNPTNVPKFGTPQYTSTFDFPTLFTPPTTTTTFQQRPTIFTNENPTTVNSPGNTWPTRYWPNTNTFEHIDPSNSGTVTKTFTTDDGSKVTTTHTVGPTKWTTHTFNYPSISGSRFPSVVGIETTTPFPSLEDFLKSQYSTTTTTTKKPPPLFTTSTIPSLLPPPGNKPVTTINVEDLPAVRVPTTAIRPEDKIFQTESLTPNIHTQTKTYRKTFQSTGGTAPGFADLDPKMKEILENAGITPEDLLNSKNGTITKTRREPDGRIVTTTYRVSTITNDDNVSGGGSGGVAEPHFKNTFQFDNGPRGPFFIADEPTTKTPSTHFDANFPSLRPQAVQPNLDNTNIFKTNLPRNFFENDLKPKVQPQPVLPPRPSPRNAIDAFLAKVNLTSDDLKASNGEIVKTFLDNDGRVLTATFVLSTVKNNNENLEDSKANPIK